MTRRKYGALLTDRQTQRQGLAKCASCRAGQHHRCRNRAYDEWTDRFTDCFCAYMSHGERPSGSKGLENIASPEPIENANDRTIYGD